MKEKKLLSIIKTLESLGSARAVKGMKRYGIVAKKVFGVRTDNLRKLAKGLRNDHQFTEMLWTTGIFDARVLAFLIDDPLKVTEDQMERWVTDFDNWAICDGCCLHLFVKTPFAWKKAREWCQRKEEFVVRAGFVLLAVLAVHDKEADDIRFVRLLPFIKRAAGDKRNGVKKAVNWALRQIGKRNVALNEKAIELAKAIRQINSSTARWIAADALRELTSEAVIKRLRRKKIAL